MIGLKKISCYLFFIFHFISGYSFSQENSPQAKIVPRDSHERCEGIEDYFLIFENFPCKQDFTISLKRVLSKDSKNAQILERLQIDENGFILKEGKVKPFCTLNSRGFAEGERGTYTFSLDDGTVIAEASFIPRPIEKKSKKGTFLIKAELLGIAPTVYKISFEGLLEKESIRISNMSGRHILDKTFSFSSNSLYQVSPQLIGRTGGKSSLETVRASGDKVKIPLRWGETVIKELKKYKYS